MVDRFIQQQICKGDRYMKLQISLNYASTQQYQTFQFIMSLEDRQL